MSSTSIPTRQIVQAGLGTTPDRGILQSVWIEIPGNCDLHCSYCFCATRGAQIRDDDPEYLAHDPEARGDQQRYRPDLYVKVIFEPFARRVREWNEACPTERIERFACPPENAATDEWVRGKIAIPGAGEPFHPANRELVLALIREANALDLHMTIFTTGHWIDDELAAELFELDVVLLVKYNSARQEVQNALVGVADDHPFFRQRQETIQRLLRVGFNKPYGLPGSPCYQKTRIGIVTSIMQSNIAELPDLLRYARDNNIIFDCDTILERGRGSGCAQCLSDCLARQGFEALQKVDSVEYDRHWEISATYAGTACDRYRHHLYVDRRGDIYPCVGCLPDERNGVPPIVLGNVKTGLMALQDAWESPVMRCVIRPWGYGGPCADCEHPTTGVCHSCLGRFRNTLHPLTRDSVETIPTIGCWNFKPKAGVAAVSLARQHGEADKSERP